jgi:hypothetical protein
MIYIYLQYITLINIFMKKKLLLFATGLFLIAGGLCVAQQFGADENVSALLMANVEALANPEHGGGSSTADTKCPIWTISWSQGVKTCTSNGVYKCDEGTCPHGL